MYEEPWSHLIKFVVILSMSCWDIPAVAAAQREATAFLCSIIDVVLVIIGVMRNSIAPIMSLVWLQSALNIKLWYATQPPRLILAGPRARTRQSKFQPPPWNWLKYKTASLSQYSFSEQSNSWKVEQPCYNVAVDHRKAPLMVSRDHYTNGQGWLAGSDLVVWNWVTSTGSFGGAFSL